VSDFEIVMGELKSFSEAMAEKPMIVVATKIDAAQDVKRVKALQKVAKKYKLPFMKISSVTGEGIDELKKAMWDALQESKTAAEADAAS
jgi:GTP-binding protein